MNQERVHVVTIEVVLGHETIESNVPERFPSLRSKADSKQARLFTTYSMPQLIMKFCTISIQHRDTPMQDI